MVSSTSACEPERQSKIACVGPIESGSLRAATRERRRQSQ